MEIKEKLNIFSEIAMKEAELKRSEILSDVEQAYQKAIEEAEKIEHKKFESYCSTEISKFRQAADREAITATTESKKKLVIKRKNLLDGLFQNVRKKLVAYTNSKEYRSYLTNQIKKLSEQYGDLEVRVQKSDLKHKSDIEKATGAKVIISKEEILGGFIAYIPAKKAMIDYSFLSRLENEQSNFNLLKINL